MCESTLWPLAELRPRYNVVGRSAWQPIRDSRTTESQAPSCSLWLTRLRAPEKSFVMLTHGPPTVQFQIYYLLNATVPYQGLISTLTAGQTGRCSGVVTAETLLDQHQCFAFAFQPLRISELLDTSLLLCARKRDDACLLVGQPNDAHGIVWTPAHLELR